MTNQKPDRDATIDRLLAGRAVRSPDDSTDACLDADTLAAWTDGALSAAELSAVEAHAADCARCQAMLAAMARTTPLGPAPAAAPWWKPALRWMVPLTAAAAAALVWTILPQRDGRVNVRQVSQSADATPAPSVETPPASREFSPVVVAPPASAVSGAPRREAQALAEAKDVDLSRRSADAEADKKAAASADANVLADATTRNAELSRRNADSSPRGAEGATAEGRADRARAAAENAAAAPAAPQPMAKTFSFGAPETIIVSSNPASRWRILQGGQVQRSADGGANWQTQTTGVSETLSGGSSPSPSVCWLVGPKGIVLRTTDGRSWTRIPFPETVPLTSIRATDDQTATVTTEDGRQFVTEDGGRTWARAPL